MQEQISDQDWSETDIDRQPVQVPTVQDAWTNDQLWLRSLLRRSRLRWTRRGPSCFWQFELGVLVVLAGQQTSPLTIEDRTALKRRQVVVIDIRAGNKADVASMLAAVRYMEPWHARRRKSPVW